MLWVLSILIFLAAVILSALGQGGGALYTPFQTWCGISFHEAATTSLFLIVVMSLSSSLVYFRAQRIDVPMAATLESVTMVGGFAGGFASDAISGTVLSLCFAAVLVVGAYFMIRSPRHNGGNDAPPRSFPTWHRTLGERTYRINLFIGIPASFVAGVLSGLLGVGGGILKVPLMVVLLGVPTEVAIGSSSLMVGLTALAGFAGHVLQGHWQWRTSLVLALAVVVGAQIGSRTSVKLAKDRLTRFFGWFLIGIAVVMAAKGLL